VIISFWLGEYSGSYALDDFQVDIVAQFVPPPPPPPHHVRLPPPPPGVVALLSFEDTDDGVSSQTIANNGTWAVAVPDARAAHSGGAGLYVEVTKPWGVASLARLLLPRYVPRAGKEMLLHLAFWARVEKMKASDPTPTVTVAFVDLHNNYEQVGSEVVPLTHTDWQMHYVVIDLKMSHVGHSIRPYLYLGKQRAIYYFDDFEYKEIEIEDGMSWLRRAPERVRRRRMGKFRLTFYDADEWPIDYGTASVSLRRHAFQLGVSLKTRPMSAMEAADYLWYLRTAAKHFWSGAIEKQLLWPNYEPVPGTVGAGQKAVDDVLAWASMQRWETMGAALIDSEELGGAAREHWSNKLACKDLAQRLHERIARDLSHFKGKIRVYEVWKGALHAREWINRCGESLHFDTYRWAQRADPAALLCPSEDAVLTTLTLTNAEAYHNLVFRLIDQGVPISAVCVSAVFSGEVDASTVKHRLDVLSELRLPVYITEFAISNLEPAQHAYELEKFLRLAFSHEAVAGITLGDIWDASPEPAPVARDAVRDAAPATAPPERPRSAGVYAANKQAKPAALRLDKLWKEEWSTELSKPMSSEGAVVFEGYYGEYEYSLTDAEGSVCSGKIELGPRADDAQAPKGEWGMRGAAADAQTIIVRCDWKGRMHIPVWTTPLLLALAALMCLVALRRQGDRLKVKAGGHLSGAQTGRHMPLRNSSYDRFK
jgi:hypothetical protein